MHFHIDTKYLGLLSPQLPKFTKKKDNTWACRCPLCGDSKKNPNKMRGYFYKRRETLFYKCHNCGQSYQFGTLLKMMNVRLYDEYVLERYKNGASGRDAHKKPKEEQIKPKKSTKRIQTIDLPSVDKLEDEHFVKEYVKNREIPEKYWSKLFFVEDFAVWVNSVCGNDNYTDLKKEDPRLLLPFFDLEGKLIGGQGRSLSSNKKDIRYITFKCEGVEKLVFGLERWDKKEKTYIVEGPIDSLFLPNALAAANPDLKALQDYLNTISTAKDVTLIFDNEPRNREIIKLIDKAIKADFNVVIWPRNVKQKDLNDMVTLGKMNQKELVRIINENTFTGLEAHVRFNSWKRR